MTLPKFTRSGTSADPEVAHLLEDDSLSSVTESSGVPVQSLPPSSQGTTASATSAASASSASSATQQTASDFAVIKIVARLTLQLIRKFWAFSSAAALAIILFYWLCGGFVAFGMVAFALSGILYHATDRFLYHPDQPATARVFVPSPAMLGLPFESIFIKSRDSTRIHMFLIKQPTEALTASAPTILYFHGNAGNIGHRLMNVKGIVQHLGANVCLLEYRGYGHSDGNPNEEGLYLDAQSGLDYLVGRPDIDSGKIIVFGRSLGKKH